MIQDEVLAFLASPTSYEPHPATVECIETHGAYVFLAGERAVKIKREVSFEYMDFSSLALRRKAIEREFALNSPEAPGLYLGVVPINRAPDGHLDFNGPGETVEFSLHMRRFAQSDLLSQITRNEELPLELCNRIAEAIVAFHARAEKHLEVDGATSLSKIINELDHVFAGQGSPVPEPAARMLANGLRERLQQGETVLRQRGPAGHILRCHGDLHLRNIVMLDGAPVLFDALEFDEDLAIVDVLYDLAFLLMDLDVVGQRASANAVLGRYLWRRDCESDLSALILLPLFLALRAGIRAMVAIQRASQTPTAPGTGLPGDAQRYLDKACAYLAPHRPALIAVGGFSGTGKTTLARALAPLLAVAPGALHIRSDLERKSLFEVEETDRLPAASYTVETAAKVYDRMLDKARLALDAGHPVIMDAVFSSKSERLAAEQIARDRQIPFAGHWLTAGKEQLVSRVATRTGDASDATPEVVEAQLARGAGQIEWTTIDAGSGPEATLAKAIAALQPAGLISSR